MATRDGVPFPMRCRLERLPVPVPEYKFAVAHGRAWRFDWAWPSERVALEVEGGAWIGGRHTRTGGYLKDMEKYNTAQVLGWIVLRCVPETLSAEATVQVVRQALEARTRPY